MDSLHLDHFPEALDRRTVAILDDVALAREGLCRMLVRAGYRVVLAASGSAEFLAQLGRSNAAVALIALTLADSDPLDGYEVLERVRDAHPSVRTVALSGRSGSEATVRCESCGAIAFVDKTAADERQLVSTLDAVSGAPPRQPPAVIAHLSPREREVARLIATGADNLKIAALLAIGERTVKAHVAALYRKLAVENRVELALWAIDAGLRG